MINNQYSCISECSDESGSGSGSRSLDECLVDCPSEPKNICKPNNICKDLIGRIEDLNKAIIFLREEDIGSFDAHIDFLQAQINDVLFTLNNLSTPEISQMNDKIKKLETEIQKLMEKNVVVYESSTKNDSFVIEDPCNVYYIRIDKDLHMNFKLVGGGGAGGVGYIDNLVYYNGGGGGAGSIIDGIVRVEKGDVIKISVGKGANIDRHENGGIETTLEIMGTGTVFTAGGGKNGNPVVTAVTKEVTGGEGGMNTYKVYALTGENGSVSLPSFANTTAGSGASSYGNGGDGGTEVTIIGTDGTFGGGGGGSVARIEPTGKKSGDGGDGLAIITFYDSIDNIESDKFGLSEKRTSGYCV